MGQARNKTGVDFEKMICESNGWAHTPKSPRIVWSGVGRTNFDKIASVGFDVTKFTPTDESILEKYDAITDKGEKVELKKYNSSKLNSWTLYSEPIFKVSNRSTLPIVNRIFGNGDVVLAVKNYNDFVEKIKDTVGEDILTKISQSNTGVQLEDCFVEQSNLEYRWIVRTGWKGFNRLIIEFRIKD
jgi:hypothetical protein